VKAKTIDVFLRLIAYKRNRFELFLFSEYIYAYRSNECFCKKPWEIFRTMKNVYDYIIIF